jgi:DEAD/DEAH box helicase
MPEFDGERLEIAEQIARDIATENTLSATQARSFVRGLQTTWEVPTIVWSDSDSRGQLRDAHRLLHAAGLFRRLDAAGASSPKAINCYRRAGELLEWLARARDSQETFVPLQLLAAGAYQLGGLPAMASALLTQVSDSSSGGHLYAKFLEGNFDEVLASVARFWRHHLDSTNRKAPQRVLETGADDKMTWFFTTELVRVLGALADSIRVGDESRFARVMAKLAGLDRVAARTLNDGASMLVTLLHQVATSYGEASIYRAVRQLAALNPLRAQRLERFARTQFSRKRGILWTSQRYGIARLLEKSSFALCTPTGSGKTLVANLALVKELLLRGEEDFGALALYLVPSRALAGEVESKLAKELGRDLVVTGLYGGADWGVTDYWLTAQEPTVLIATVEKADALMRYLGPVLSQRLRLLIIDEAHQVVPDDNERTRVDFAEHANRSIRLESFVSRLLTVAPDIARIALTAVAGGAASPIASWIEGEPNAEFVGTQYRSTRQIVGIFETDFGGTGRMLLQFVNGRPLFVQRRAEPVYIPLRMATMPRLPPRMRDSIYCFNALDVLWTSLHLAHGGRRILISVTQQPEKIMRWYVEALELEDWSGVPRFQPPVSDEDRARLEEARAACVDYCGEGSYESELLNRGIATSHGQMPQRLRRLMTDLIERGVCSITVATATLTEGVNLPFDIIFLTALKRQSFNPSTNRSVPTRMSTAEFRNLAGRSGRPGASNGIEGITLVAIPRRPSTTADGRLQTQRDQIRALRSDYIAVMRSLVAEELEQVSVKGPLALLLHSIAEKAKELLGIEGDALLEWLEGALLTDVSEDAGQGATTGTARLADSIDELDGVLLSALEETQRLEAGELQGAAAEATLARLWQRTFTAHAAAQEEWLERAVIRRGQGILRNVYPDREERARLYQYGLTPHVGRRFEVIVPDLRQIIVDAADYGIADADARLNVFIRLGLLVAGDRGYGFRVRATATDQALLENWIDVLRWWLRAPNRTEPDPDALRAWQRFVSDNIEFRLGVAVGGVVARAWSDGAADPLAVPSLESWRDTTALPWFGFWARELLRWGTLDPFVAFSLAQGRARTRDEALGQRSDFEDWLLQEYGFADPESLIDPQRFLEWHRIARTSAEQAAVRVSVPAQLLGTTGQRGNYRVIPVKRGHEVIWLDPAGYALAHSAAADSPFRGRVYGHDFELRVARERTFVHRVFSGQ